MTPAVEAGRTNLRLTGFSTQTAPDNAAHLFLLPAADTRVTLLTHIGELSLAAGEDGSLEIQVEARYRLHNPGSEPTSLPLQLVPIRAPAGPPGQRSPVSLWPRDIQLSVRNQILNLETAADQSARTTEIRFQADERLEFQLAYRLRLSDPKAPAVIYPSEVLERWPGRVGSMRVDITVPDSLPPESWLRAEPQGWRFDSISLKWLYENGIPQQPIVLQVVHPALWIAIKNAENTSEATPSPASFTRLGDHYRQILQAPNLTGELRQRFYAQALAAYVEGVRVGNQAGAPAGETAPLHSALAALYRSRSINDDGTLDETYVDLMVAEAGTALAQLPAEADSNHRLELQRWLAEGLRVQLDQAESRQDWILALDLLEQLTGLPPNVVDPVSLDEERNTVLLQQALQLLNQGNREAAIALVGPDVAAGDLAPSGADQSLFASWEITMTVGVQETTLQMVFSPALGREEVAQQAVEQLLRSWQAASAAAVDQPGNSLRNRVFVEDIGSSGPGSEDQPAFAIRLAIPDTATRLALVQAIPPNITWALLQLVLVQAEPEITNRRRLLWRQTVLTQSLDLRAAGDQWRAMAASLERQAGQLEAPYSGAASINPETSSNAARAAFRNRLQAIYYRQEALIWQNMADNSFVRVTLEIPGEAGAERLADARSWVITLADSPQTLTMRGQAVDVWRLFGFVLAALSLVILLSTVFWLLL